MPISSVNFGRWLERLGFKHLEQPPFHQSVTPVSIVQDQRQLVSNALGPSGIHGAAHAGGAELPAFQFFGPSPAWIDIVLSADTTGSAAITLGTGARPVLNAATLLPRQGFQPGGDVLVERGTQVPVPSNDLPSLRIGTTFVYSPLQRIHKPAGGWVQLSSRGLATLHMSAWVYELPSENAQ